jgi:hypothetical protein
LINFVEFSLDIVHPAWETGGVLAIEKYVKRTIGIQAVLLSFS